MKNCNPPPEIRFFKRVQKTDSCWVWIGKKHSDGYGEMTINFKVKKTHRYSWEIHRGEIPKGMLVCHKCDNPPCVNPEHLFLGTNADNSLDRKIKGRAYRHLGEANGRAKLNKKQVAQIRALRSRGIKRKIVAEKFNVAMVTIDKIHYGETWRDLLHKEVS